MPGIQSKRGPGVLDREYLGSLHPEEDMLVLDPMTHGQVAPRPRHADYQEYQGAGSNSRT